VLGVPDNYKVLFLQGGGTLQFSALPLNLMGKGRTIGDYAVTGQWGEKAYKECAKYGSANLVCNTKTPLVEGGKGFTRIPDVGEWKLGEGNKVAFLHYTANETVNGVEFPSAPVLPESYSWSDNIWTESSANYQPVPLCTDMSSNFMTKNIECEKHAVIYAGAQKNIGPSGNCVVIVDDKYLGKGAEMGICPTYCSYKAAADAGSMYNTPACYSIYVTGTYLKYTKSKGGVNYWEELCGKKSKMIYDIIDDSDYKGFYTNPVEVSARSRVNIPFQIKGGDDALEKKFLEEGKKRYKLYTLAGHRSVGGIRASLYNGTPMNGIEALRAFMIEFAQENMD